VIETLTVPLRRPTGRKEVFKPSSEQGRGRGARLRPLARAQSTVLMRVTAGRHTALLGAGMSCPALAFVIECDQPQRGRTGRDPEHAPATRLYRRDRPARAVSSRSVTMTHPGSLSSRDGRPAETEFGGPFGRVAPSFVEFRRKVFADELTLGRFLFQPWQQGSTARKIRCKTG
jgi:hypothetical protein